MSLKCPQKVSFRKKRHEKDFLLTQNIYFTALQKGVQKPSTLILPRNLHETLDSATEDAGIELESNCFLEQRYPIDFHHARLCPTTAVCNKDPVNYSGKSTILIS